MKKTILIAIISGIISGVIGLLVLNFWGANLAINSGFIYPLAIIVVITSVCYFSVSKFENKKDKIIHSLVFLVINSVVSYATLIFLIMYAWSLVKY